MLLKCYICPRPVCWLKLMIYVKILCNLLFIQVYHHWVISQNFTISPILCFLSQLKKELDVDPDKLLATDFYLCDLMDEYSKQVKIMICSTITLVLWDNCNVVWVTVFTGKDTSWMRSHRYGYTFAWKIKNFIM